MIQDRQMRRKGAAGFCSRHDGPNEMLVRRKLRAQRCRVANDHKLRPRVTQGQPCLHRDLWANPRWIAQCERKWSGLHLVSIEADVRRSRMYRREIIDNC